MDPNLTFKSIFYVNDHMTFFHLRIFIYAYGQCETKKKSDITVYYVCIKEYTLQPSKEQ
jgi:hypothetical protein